MTGRRRDGHATGCGHAGTIDAVHGGLTLLLLLLLLRLLLLELGNVLRCVDRLGLLGHGASFSLTKLLVMLLLLRELLVVLLLLLLL